MRNRQIWIIATLLIYIDAGAYGKCCIDPLQHPVTLTVNADTCKMVKDSDLGVCFLNNTGKDLHFRELFLEEAFSAFKGTYSGVSNIDYTILKQNQYLILESNRVRVKAGDKINEIPYDNVEYFLRPPFEKILSGCEFKWDPLIPPYSEPAVLVIENSKDGYKCSYA